MTDADKPLAADIATLMAGWDKIQAAAREQFPAATEAQIDQLTRGAMNAALGLKG